MAVSNFRIYNENYADEDIVASFTSSSERAAFPDDNVLSFERRSKVCRSNGYWVITTSNHRLTFRETTVVDLTATLNTGTYDGDEFMAELERALE